MWAGAAGDGDREEEADTIPADEEEIGCLATLPIPLSPTISACHSALSLPTEHHLPLPADTRRSASAEEAANSVCVCLSCHCLDLPPIML